MLLVNSATFREPKIARNAGLLLLEERNGRSSAIPPCHWRLNNYRVTIRYLRISNDTSMIFWKGYGVCTDAGDLHSEEDVWHEYWLNALRQWTWGAILVMLTIYLHSSALYSKSYWFIIIIIFLICIYLCLGLKLARNLPSLTCLSGDHATPPSLFLL